MGPGPGWFPGPLRLLLWLVLLTNWDVEDIEGCCETGQDKDTSVRPTFVVVASIELERVMGTGLSVDDILPNLGELDFSSLKKSFLST